MIFLWIVLIIIGFVLLIKGADFLVEGAAGIAKRFGIPTIIIGLTIVSIGTSMPELFVSITSNLKGLSDVSVGNVIGSNLCNLLLILGMTAIFRDIKISKTTKFIEIPFLIFSTFLFFILAKDGTISRWNSLVLLVLFCIFIFYTIIRSKYDDDPGDSEIEDSSVIKSIVYVLLGIVALKYGGDFVVDNAEKIAKAFHLSDKIIGVTIIALGTSLPELVTSIVAARKDNVDMAIGNVVGSNIFNILLIIGVSGFINDIVYSSAYNIDLLILGIVSTILFLIPFFGKKDYMTKFGGIAFVSMYFMYMIYSIICK